MISRRALAAAGATGVLLAGLGLMAPAEAAQVASVPHYKNCTELNAKYKHGVGLPGARDKVPSKNDKPVTNFYRSKAIYLANKKLDRDHDNIACEKH